MGQPVVHFEIIGADPAGLRGFFGDLFGWEFDTSGAVANGLVVGHFTDPEGNLVGVAGPR
ncbi:MAG TPA: hypothetical protein VMA77_10730 [Solirubrobacteraceae bacterium]|nr:hypothetical protein [Solirubrobacteraceae bacterium]